jgi:alcohol dehydrogenase
VKQVKAVLYEQFGGPLRLAQVEAPRPAEHGVVIRVEASGICRSDWHGWMGHDPDIRSLPHVPGHELAGTVAEVGGAVTRWRVGDRVTVPFVCGCGACPPCQEGKHHVCDHQTQPGFTHWGSFAERVAVHQADVNLVALPDELSFAAAASLGCRFATAYRAVVDQGRVARGQWVAVHGCGGVGLSAVMIAAARGARVIAVDVDPGALELAESLGAAAAVNARETGDVAARVQQISGRGAHLSLDALGSAVTCRDAILGLRKGGRHVQVGLLAGEDHRPRLPMERVIGWELELLGSHGMQAHRYPELLSLIGSGALQPQRLIGRTIGLEQAPQALREMGDFGGAGITVITDF